MFGFSIIKTKELQRLRDIDKSFTSIIRSKEETIESLMIRIEQLKVINERNGQEKKHITA